MVQHGLSIQIVPRVGVADEYMIYVNATVWETKTRCRTRELLALRTKEMPDFQKRDATECAIEATDMVYQLLTELYASEVKDRRGSEVNARPADTSTT